MPSTLPTVTCHPDPQNLGDSPLLGSISESDDPFPQPQLQQGHSRLVCWALPASWLPHCLEPATGPRDSTSVTNLSLEPVQTLRVPGHNLITCVTGLPCPFREPLDHGTRTQRSPPHGDGGLGCRAPRSRALPALVPRWAPASLPAVRGWTGSATLALGNAQKQGCLP